MLVKDVHHCGVKMGQSIWSNFSVADYKSSLENENDLYQKFKSTACSFWFSASPFQVWLKYGNEERPPPEQLPIVLQVLLSQAHRLKALDLLGQFLDLGPWAVNLALSVGIFPYVLRLLQVKFRITRTYTLWALNSIWQVNTDNVTNLDSYIYMRLQPVIQNSYVKCGSISNSYSHDTI